MVARYQDSNWVEFGLTTAGTDDTLMSANTLSAARTPGGIYLAYIRPSGALGVSFIEF